MATDQIPGNVTGTHKYSERAASVRADRARRMTEKSHPEFLALSSVRFLELGNLPGKVCVCGGRLLEIMFDLFSCSAL
jgi:hypothetical protein